MSLAESLTASFVMTVAGSAAITALAAGLTASTDAARRTLAAGLADDLADEVFALPVRAPADRTDDPAPRNNYDDADDCAGWSAAPPVGPDGAFVGVPGTFTGKLGDSDADRDQLDHFRRTVAVVPVAPDTSGPGYVAATATSRYRRVTVTVWWVDGRPGVGDLPLAERTAVLIRAPE